MSERPVAMVVGGVRRVGRAIAAALAASGCDLVLTYRNSGDAAGEARAEFEKDGARVGLERLDLDDVGAVAELARRMCARGDRLDVLVLSASMYEPSEIEALEPGGVERQFRVNAVSPLLLCAGLAPLLGRSVLEHGGAVVAMCDMHAMGRPRRGFASYSMSKAALVEMVRSLARELAPSVRVNGVAPGVVAWPESGPDADLAAQRAYLSRVPLARSGTPRDAAEVVRWLALDAGYVTGEIVRVDGGRWLA
ncbi:MAG: SDR family oxidoreductase [Phycisphaeraceae bacterium]|nr:SDR family oxidoreductase [Phycisphaeraceae bacterium]